MADVGSVTNFNSSLPNPLATLGNVMSIANTAQQNQLLQTANQQRQFDLHKAQNDAVNGIIGPLATIPNLDSKQAQTVILPQLKALGLDPATSPVAAQHIGPLLDGTLDDPKKMKLWQLGHTAPFLGAAGFGPTTGPATGQGAPTTVLPIERAAMPGPQPSQFGPAAQAAGAAYGGAAGGALAGSAANEMDFKRQVTPLEQAIPALQRLGTTGTGPGTDEINKMKSAAVSFGFAPSKWTGTVKDY